MFKASADPQRESRAIKRGLAQLAQKLNMRWARLAGATWTADEALALVEALNELADQSHAFEHTALADCALDFGAYLSTFADLDLKPQATQLAQLEELARLFALAAGALDPDHDGKEAPKAEALKRECLVVGQAPRLVDGLAEALAELALQWRCADSAESARAYIAEHRPTVLLIDARLLSHVSTLIDLAEDAASARVLCLVMAEQADLAKRLLALRAGADGYFSLPVPAARVARRVRELLLSDFGEPIHVLVIEDDHSQALFADAVLRGRGFSVRLAFKAQDALLAISERRPDAIVLDQNLPELSGFELAELIRIQPGLLTVPIAFVTGDPDPGLRGAAMAQGDEYLAKPIKPRHLVSTVLSLVRRARELKLPSYQDMGADAATGLAPLATLLHALQSRRDLPQLNAVIYVQIDQRSKLARDLGMVAITELEPVFAQALSAELGAHSIGAHIQAFTYAAVIEGPDRTAIEARVERILASFRGARFRVAGEPLQVTVSIGMAHLDPGLGRAESMLAAARQMAMAVEAEGGDAWRRYVPQQPRRDQTQRRASIIAMLERAPSEATTRLRFEPWVPLVGSVAGQFDVELGLLAPPHGERLIDAEDWEPIAADTKRLLEYKGYELTQALAVVSQASGAPTRLWVRLTAEHLRSGAVDGVRQVLSTREFRAQMLGIRFDAGLAVDLGPQLIERLGRYRELGVKLCLDHFGRDRVAVHMLPKLPIDAVRFDPALIAGAGEEPGGIAAFEVLVRRAQQALKWVVVPKVESSALLNVLWDLGVDYVTGSLVGMKRAEPRYEQGELVT